MTLAIETTAVPGTSWRRILRRATRKRGLVLGAAIVFAVAFMAIAASWLAPYSPYEQNLDIRIMPPSFLGGQTAHPLGTDLMGRDYLTRLMYGARVALLVGIGTRSLAMQMREREFVLAARAAGCSDFRI